MIIIIMIKDMITQILLSFLEHTKKSFSLPDMNERKDVFHNLIKVSMNSITVPTDTVRIMNGNPIFRNRLKVILY
jgi:hypothetical protein